MKMQKSRKGEKEKRRKGEKEKGERNLRKS